MFIYTATAFPCIYDGEYDPIEKLPNGQTGRDNRRVLGFFTTEELALQCVKNETSTEIDQFRLPKNSIVIERYRLDTRLNHYEPDNVLSLHVFDENEKCFKQVPIPTYWDLSDCGTSDVLHNFAVSTFLASY